MDPITLSAVATGAIAVVVGIPYAKSFWTWLSRWWRYNNMKIKLFTRVDNRHIFMAIAMTLSQHCKNLKYTTHVTFPVKTNDPENPIVNEVYVLPEPNTFIDVKIGDITVTVLAVASDGMTIDAFQLDCHKDHEEKMHNFLVHIFRDVNISPKNIGNILPKSNILTYEEQGLSSVELDDPEDETEPDSDSPLINAKK